MADEEFIKKIGLRKNNKTSEAVEFNKSIVESNVESTVESTVSEETIDIESKDINADLSCEVIENISDDAPVTTEEAPIESGEDIAEESNENHETSGVVEETKAEETDFPTSIQFEDELIRVKYKLRYRKLLKNTLYSLLIVAAISVLIATLFLPVLEIYGSSMNPTLENGDIVVCIKTKNLKRGDICGMFYNNHLLVKRVIGLPGDSIEMDDAGNLFVNGEYVDEPYISEKVLGECDLDFPYVVPEQTVFILGDNRPVAVDSRNEQFGCISYEEIQGKIVFRVWPFKNFGVVL